MQRKTIEKAEIKIAGEDGPGSIELYASTFGNYDRVKEAVQPGAFTDCLAQFKEAGFITVGHQWGALPIATITEAVEDQKGLLVRADFHSTEEAQKARTVAVERLQRGKSVGASIGYEVLDSTPAKNEKGETIGTDLTRLDLYEVSLVTVPCNPEALAVGAKGASSPLAAHSDTVLAAVGEWAARVKEVQALRAKEGRTISSANMQRMQQVHDAMMQALANLRELMGMEEQAETEEETAEGDTAKAALAALARFRQLEFQHFMGGTQ